MRECHCAYVHAFLPACVFVYACMRVRVYACVCMCVGACEYQLFMLGARRCIRDFNYVQRLCSCLYTCVRTCGCARVRCYASTMFDAHIASSFVEVHLLTWQSSPVRWTPARIMPHAAI